jgi:hypothetical protein
LAIIAGFAIGVLPFTVRNYVVSGRPVMLVESWLQIPYFLYPPGQPNPIGVLAAKPPSLTQSLGLALQRARSDPAGVALLELRKAGFTFGFSSFRALGTSMRPEFIFITLLVLLALWRRRVEPPWPPILLAFCLSHVGAMMIAAPWTYPYKSLVPLHVIMLTMTAGLWQPAVARRPSASDPPEAETAGVSTMERAT